MTPREQFIQKIEARGWVDFGGLGVLWTHGVFRFGVANEIVALLENGKIGVNVSKQIDKHGDEWSLSALLALPDDQFNNIYGVPQ